MSLSVLDSSMPLGFAGIVKESPKIFCKNGQLMASLTLLYLSLSSIFFSLIVFSINPITSDLITKASLLPATDPKSPEFAYLLIYVKNDVRALVGVEWMFFIINMVASLFFATATIKASGLTYGGKNLSLKELLLLTAKSLKRPFCTWLYTTFLGLGYIFFVLANLLPMLLIVQSPVASIALSIFVAIVSTILYNYLAVIWTLALVVSVLEEKSGIEALGKAAQIVKGLQLHGFVLNLVFVILSFISFQAMRLVLVKQYSTLAMIFIGLIVLISSCLVKIFWWISYTVFYYQCKKTHGEEVELQGNIGYKIPTFQLLNESIYPDEQKFSVDVI